MQTQIQPAGPLDQLIVAGQEPTGLGVQGTGHMQGILRGQPALTLQFMRSDSD